MEDLERARRDWESERPKYQAFGDLLKPRMESVVQSLGFHGTVECRIKTMQSVLGKLLAAPEKTYELIGDKLGLRIIVLFRPQCDEVVERLRAEFKCENIEEMGARLGENQVGYLGTHLDLGPQPQDITATDFAGLTAEVQVRTLAQHLWADISHQISYKSPGSHGLDLARRMSLTSGALELVDREFTRLHDEITTQPEFAEGVVLAALEREFFRVLARRCNRDLSLEVVSLLLPLYESANEAAAHFRPWFEQNEILVRTVYRKAEGDFVTSAFLLQPEAFMILDLLQSNQFKLRDLWNHRFPERELQIFAEYWGRSLY